MSWGYISVISCGDNGPETFSFTAIAAIAEYGEITLKKEEISARTDFSESFVCEEQEWRLDPRLWLLLQLLNLPLKVGRISKYCLNYSCNC